MSFSGDQPRSADNVDKAPPDSSTTSRANDSREQQRKNEELRSVILTQLLDQSALARLNTLRMIKPERAQMAEQYLVGLAQSGQIGSKLNDEALVSLLEQMNTQVRPKAPKITFQRRRNPLDDDDF